jgi:uncharacterized membrane protein YgcG
LYRYTAAVRLREKVVDVRECCYDDPAVYAAALSCVTADSPLGTVTLQQALLVFCVAGGEVIKQFWEGLYARQAKAFAEAEAQAEAAGSPGFEAAAAEVRLALRRLEEPLGEPLGDGEEESRDLDEARIDEFGARYKSYFDAQRDVTVARQGMARARLARLDALIARSLAVGGGGAAAAAGRRGGGGGGARGGGRGGGGGGGGGRGGGRGRRYEPVPGLYGVS